MNRKLAKNTYLFLVCYFFYLCYDLIEDLEFEKITKNFVLGPNIYLKIILLLFYT